MKKKDKTRAEIYKRDLEICNRITKLRDTAAKEQRELTEDEKVEIQTLTREKEGLGYDLAQFALVGSVSESQKRMSDVARDLLLNKRDVRIELSAEVQKRDDTEFIMTDAVEDTGIIKISEQEMLKPIRVGLIWDKVGLKVCTGLPGQTLRWPTHGTAKAQWLAEGERMKDASIDFGKLECTPVRIGLPIPVTRELLESSNGIVEQVVREELPAAVIEAINEALFTTEGGGKVVGPLVEAYKNAKECEGEIPTRKELLQAKADVVSKIQPRGLCWVMNEATKAYLEDEKVDEGSGRFVCEDDKVLGYPVFTTSSIPEGDVALGDWGYQGAGFFGPTTITADATSLVRNNAVDFVLNGHFGTKTLNQDAFVYLKANK